MSRCETTYWAEFRGWEGKWLRYPEAYKDAVSAREAVRAWLGDYKYRGVPVRVVKVHAHVTETVIDASEGA